MVSGVGDILPEQPKGHTKQLLKTKEIWKSTSGRLLYFLLSFSLFLPLLLSSMLKQKAFLTVFQALHGQDSNTDSTLLTLYARQLVGAANEKDLFVEGGSGEKLLHWRHGWDGVDFTAYLGIKQLIFLRESDHRRPFNTATSV